MSLFPDGGDGVGRQKIGYNFLDVIKTGNGNVKMRIPCASTWGRVAHIDLVRKITMFYSHPATRRRGDVVTTSLCTFQRRHSYVSNETPNNVSMERHQDVSIVRLHVILFERRDDVSRGRNNDVSSVRLHDVSSKSQMKHPTTSHWYVTNTSQWYVSTMSHYYVPRTSPVSLKWNTH